MYFIYPFMKKHSIPWICVIFICIIQELMEQLLIEKPEDPLQFLIDELKKDTGSGTWN